MRLLFAKITAIILESTQISCYANDRHLGSLSIAIKEPQIYENLHKCETRNEHPSTKCTVKKSSALRVRQKKAPARSLNRTICNAHPATNSRCCALSSYKKRSRRNTILQSMLRTTQLQQAQQEAHSAAKES